MQTKHEPGFDDVIRDSIVFLNTVGMRLSPELLVQELFRDVFFVKSPQSREMNLDPKNVDPETGEEFFDAKEKAVLYAFRGRRKQKPQSKRKDFYAPAYPVLARGGWSRKSAERVVKYQLFGGPIGLFLAGKDASVKDEAVQNMLNAFLGNNRATGGNVSRKEFFSAALKNSDIEGTYLDWEKNIHDLIAEAREGFFDDDEFVSRIYHDFNAICELEKCIPRLQWLDILMTFLRIALPAWYIAQSRISILLRDWIVKAIDHNVIPDRSELESSLKGRYRGLFHPSEVPTLETNDHVSNYIKARVELNIAMNLLVNKVGISDLVGKRLSFGRLGNKMVTVEQLLLLAKSNRMNIMMNVDQVGTFRKFLTREGEKWNAWKDPLKKGQGKNFEEFLRVLYKCSEGDDSGGYLLSRVGGARGQGFRVFPGHLLTKTVVQLAFMERNRCNPGKLLISDVERQFSSYGIEFGAVAGARPRLLSMLSELGLLQGSPDAGECSEVRIPYDISARSPK